MDDLPLRWGIVLHKAGSTLTLRLEVGPLFCMARSLASKPERRTPVEPLLRPRTHTQWRLCRIVLSQNRIGHTGRLGRFEGRCCSTVEGGHHWHKSLGTKEGSIATVSRRRDWRSAEARTSSSREIVTVKANVVWDSRAGFEHCGVVESWEMTDLYRQHVQVQVRPLPRDSQTARCF